MITVANHYHRVSGVSIMRPSPLGNPYSHLANAHGAQAVATREVAIAAYRRWLARALRQDGPVWREVQRLRQLAASGDVVLLCCCTPRPCHGDVLKALLEWLAVHPAWQPGDTWPARAEASVSPDDEA